MDRIGTGKGRLQCVLVAVLAAVMMLSVCFGLPRPVSAESLYIRKVVSVVYDDSGSMSGEKWAYANYAMQAFCGMLNSEDQLYITYMSGLRRDPNYRPEQVDLSAGGIQASVDDIRGHTDSSTTPFRAVELAFEQLKSTDDSNVNTQYWLVVITDGVFDEHTFESTAEVESILNDTFGGYADETMPNGTKPQVTFLGIGNVAAPDEDTDKGIYTYSAQNAADIRDAMDRMADRISGRTRIGSEQIRQVSDRAVQVSSSIPLLNIVLFTQSTEAKVVAAEQGGGSIPVSRSVALSYPGYAALTGGAFLLGDSQQAIEAGDYTITFDRAVELEDLVVLFEPALELRMTITLNGKEVAGPDALNGAMEGDVVSVSCAIYEMGTDSKIDSALLPADTEYMLTVTENGAVTEQIAGQALSLPDYTLGAYDTEIAAAVTIRGFNPIRYSIRFTPQKEPEHIYTLSAAVEGEDTALKIDEIGGNQTLHILFSLYDKGVPVTDPAIVQGLQPVISVSPDGNGGEVAYRSDGTIVFTPQTAAAPQGADEKYAVQVTCTVGGASVSASYDVWLVDYEIVAIDAEGTVRKTEFFENSTGVSFYITRDGVRLDKAATLNGLEIALNEEHADLLLRTDVADDGTVTVTPYADAGHTVTFGNWWGNWLYYWKLSGADVAVTLRHPYGTATATIDVIGADVRYQLLNVYLPLLVELAIALFLITWVWLVVTKPRFPKGARLYYGEIEYNSYDGEHYLKNFNYEYLANNNHFFKNGIWKFKRKADSLSISLTESGVSVRPERGGSIYCEGASPGYYYNIQLQDRDLQTKVVDLFGQVDLGKLGERFQSRSVLQASIKGLTKDFPLPEDNILLLRINKGVVVQVKTLIGNKNIIYKGIFLCLIIKQG